MLANKSPAKAVIKSHRDLIVWQKAMDLVVSVYRATETFPKAETYGLTSQIRRAVTSIPANIAEGQGRRLAKEFIYFLANARGSLWELDTHIESATRLGFCSSEKQVELQMQMDEVGRILNGLMRSVSDSAKVQRPAI
ncbi:MAG: four helix bundle protein [Acidobacteriota bacterium]|nr:four helix bundle protein [Acidobacteriota bacterium]